MTDELKKAYEDFAKCTLATPDAKGKFPLGVVKFGGDIKPLTHAMSQETFDAMRTFMGLFARELAKSDD